MIIPKISIITPVYNVEKFINECVDSVLSQQFKEWEMILIDDGGTDKCPDICDRYAQLDTRIKVIHQANSGVSAARNTGIRHAEGEYLYFLDADDLLPKDALESLVKLGSRYEWPEYIKGSHYVLTKEKRIVKTRFTPPPYFYRKMQSIRHIVV